MPNAKAVKALDAERRAGALPAEIARVYDDLKKLATRPMRQIPTSARPSSPTSPVTVPPASSRQLPARAGRRSNFACEYATKRYRSNCINWGMLPFLMKDPAVLDNGDYVYLPGVRKALLNADDELTAIAVKPDGGVVRFTVSLGAMTDAERQILADGCLINYYKNN